MARPTPAPRSAGRPRSRFVTTSWTKVSCAGDRTQNAAAALEALCRDYWYPLYAFLRRRGSSAHEAEDTIQSFFAWMLEKNILARADRNRGRFRTFLITALKQFAARRYRHANARKRRPKGPVISIHAADLEGRYRNDVRDDLTPEHLYEYRFALAVLKRAMDRLREEFRASGREERMQCLQGFLTGQRGIPGREAAQRLGISEGAVRVAVHRMKRRVGELIRQEVGQTLDDPDKVDAEIRHLLSTLSQ